jgi:hypothetical protein
MSEQDQLGGAQVSEPQRKQAAAPKFRHQRQVHKRQLELRALPRVHKVAMRQHGRFAPNRGALYSGNQRFLEINQGVDQSRLRTFPCCWRFFIKSSRPLPAQNESPAACQSATRTWSSFAASSTNSAIVIYVLEVIYFFLSGRFSWILRMFPERSAIMSLIAGPPVR